VSENPSHCITARVPISETGTSIIGISVARQSCKKKDYQKHENEGFEESFVDLMDRFLDEHGGVVHDCIVDSGPKP
jgi:hypothetical protein